MAGLVPAISFEKPMPCHPNRDCRVKPAMTTEEVAGLLVHPFFNAGITSFANQRSCSLNSLGPRPSAQ